MPRGGISCIHLSQNSVLTSVNTVGTNRGGKICLENPQSSLANSNQVQHEEI